MAVICAPSFVPPCHITFRSRYPPPTTLLLVGLHPQAAKCLQTTTSTMHTASKASEVDNPSDTTVAAPTASLFHLGAAYVALMSTLHQAPLVNADLAIQLAFQPNQSPTSLMTLLTCLRWATIPAPPPPANFPDVKVFKFDGLKEGTHYEANLHKSSKSIIDARLSFNLPSPQELQLPPASKLTMSPIELVYKAFH